MTDTQRFVRTCDRCKTIDSHAHHIQYAAFKHPITGEGVDISVSKHIQCCAADGCEVCATDVEFAPDAQIGDGFTSYAQAKSTEHLAAITARHGISTTVGA